METDGATNPAEMPEVEDIEEVETDELEGDELEGEEELDEDGNPVEKEPQEPDEVEVEYEGQKYKVPAALKDGILRQSDYTRKTQEVAEIRKELEATIGRVNEASQQERAIEAQFAMNEAAIKEYQQIDWHKWMESDPVAANKARIDYQDLQTNQTQLNTAYQKARGDRLAVEQQETAKRIAEGQKFLAEKIPDWGQDKANAILKFGQEAYGLSADELREITDPRALLILNDAMQARQTQKAAATVRKVQQVQAVKPAATIKGGAAPVRGLDDKLSPDEWIRRRNAQVAKR